MLILTILFNYANHILSLMLNKKIMLYILLKKRKTIIILEITLLDTWRQVYYNKFYKKKRSGTYKILFC